MTKRKNSKAIGSGHCRHDKGYSLIEMAIAILIIGLLVAPAADVYSNYLKHQQYQTTLENTQAIMSALDTYRTANGFFPCPSGLNVARTAATYGAPVACNMAGAFATTPATGNCDLTSGVCIEATQRASLVALPSNAINDYKKRIIVGAVPFRQLQIPEKKAYDGYGNRLIYVLTQSMADSTQVNTLNGGITIQSPTGKPMVNPADSAVFAVFSPGADGVGAWSAEGTTVKAPCVGAPGADARSCNPGFEGGTARATSLVIDGYPSTAAGANHFDDYVMYFQSQPDPLWSYVSNSGVPTTNIKDLTDQSVGVGTSTPNSAVAIDVAAATTAPVLSDGSANTDSLLVYGTVAAGNTGKLGADTICDSTGINCFDPLHIGGTATGTFGGTNPGMGCPAGKVMAGVDGATANITGGADCVDVAITCPVVGGVQQVLNGFVGGVPQCQTPAQNCGATVAASPGAGCPTVSIGAGITGSSQTFNQTLPTLSPWNPSGCRSVTYTCSGGSWSKTADNGGVCALGSCTNPGCTCVIIHGGSSGNYANNNACTRQTCPSCAGNVTTITSDTCTCHAPVTSAPTACTSPFTTGTKTRVTTYSGASCTGTAGPYDCSGCGPNPATQTVACGAGYNTGVQNQQRTVNVASCNYNGWTNTTNTCACDQTLVCAGPYPCTRTLTGQSCGNGTFTGSQPQIFNNTAGVCAWQNNGAMTGCACPANYTETQACPSPALGNRTRTHTYGAYPTCTDTVSAWNQTGCTCPANFVESQACPANYVSGNQTRNVTYGAAPTCTRSNGAWNTSACACAANYTETSACISPYTGGTRTRSHTIGAGPSCTDTAGSWNVSACTCPASYTETTACPSPWGSGNQTRTHTINPTTCGDTVSAWNTSGCACPSNYTETGSCPSGFSSGNSTRAHTYGPGPTCTASVGSWDYSACVCNTTPQNSTQAHDCSPNPPYGLDCYDPDTPDTVTITNTYNPVGPTCTAGAPVVTPSGTCKAKSFTWVNRGANGGVQNPKPSGANILGTGCGCPQHRNTLAGAMDICYDPDPSNFLQYDCDCQ